MIAWLWRLIVGNCWRHDDTEVKRYEMANTLEITYQCKKCKRLKCVENWGNH